MAKYKVVTKWPDNDSPALDGVIVFPQNRTLYVDQFTDKAPDSDEEREVFSPKCMKDVFEHYRPQKEIGLNTEYGEIANENFCFHSIEDFEDNQLIEQSEVLCKQKANIQAQDIFRKNLCHVHEQVRNLEIAYRTLDAFFSNVAQDGVDCITIMNVDKKKLAIYDSTDTEAIKEELGNKYNALSLRDSYSLLVIPGYLGRLDDKDTKDRLDVVQWWAQTANKNKVILITDFKDRPGYNYEMLKNDLDKANLQGQDRCLANIIMTCNYLLGREKSKLADEEDNLYIPASGALAGRLANTEEIVISQGVAGKKFGKLNNVKGIRLNFSKVEIAGLINQGVIPMIEDEGYIMAFSTCSLYNGSLTFLQEYPVVRVLDWICKVLINFLNSQAFLNWNLTVRTELREKIMDFLDDYKGYNDVTKLIESYNIKKLEQESVTKDISLVIGMKFHYCIHPIVVELTWRYDNLDGPMWKDNNYLKTNNYNN